MLTRPVRLPRTVITHLGAPRRPGRPRWLYGRPHLLFPGGDGLLVALQGALHRYLHRPAVSPQQLADALDGVPDVEQFADQRLDPCQRPALVIAEPVRQRAPVRLGL